MRTLAISIATAALMASPAFAAPSFGPAGHWLGGDDARAKQEKGVDLPSAVLSLFGIDLAATITPVASEAYEKKVGSKECDQAKKTEVAKAEPKASDASGSKGRARAGEPVYLAF